MATARRHSKLMSFDLLESQPAVDDARLGRLSFHGRVPMETPNYVAASSRGAVPHISQDMMRDNTAIKSMYTALEDYIEKAPLYTPPVLQFQDLPEESPLRKFIALQEDALLILGPRHIPPLPCPASSTNTAISIVTSFGFSMLESADYMEAVQRLRPDVTLAMGDVLFGHQPGVKRMDKMGDRTLAWLNELIAGVNDEHDGAPNTAIFAPILPVPAEKQFYYLDALQSELKDELSGLVLYETISIEATPKALHHLPRLWLGEIKGPCQLLEAIAAGVDIFTIPFITEATDAGIALDFSFAVMSNEEVGSSKPLGIDLWAALYAVELSPLSEGCTCYTCTHHHKAFVHHLLDAKEMLGWVLLQLHNHHAVDEFFVAVRQSIQQGRFEHDKRRFAKAYETDLPAKTGQGPRIRGYQFKSEGKGESRKNPVAYGPLDDGKEKLAEALLPSPNADADDLEQHGFAEKTYVKD